MSLTNTIIFNCMIIEYRVALTYVIKAQFHKNHLLY